MNVSRKITHFLQNYVIDSLIFRKTLIRHSTSEAVLSIFCSADDVNNSMKEDYFWLACDISHGMPSEMLGGIVICMWIHKKSHHFQDGGSGRKSYILEKKWYFSF